MSKQSSSTKPIYRNVSGAPFRIGSSVQVSQIIDSTESQDLVGRVGKILYLEYSCGCGQSYPEDPMIGVVIEGECYEFWKEELAVYEIFPS